MRCDVLVVGGGSAGLTAAVAAGRAGADVVLIERHGSLGGMATASLIHSICGLYLLQAKPDATPANPGLATELAGRLIALGGAAGPVRMGRVDVLLQHPTLFACAADQMLGELSQRITPRFHTELISATPSAGERDQDWRVEVICRGQRTTIDASAVVDASGDAVVAALSSAGFDQAQADRLQRPAYVFALQGVDEGATAPDARLRIAGLIARAVKDGELPGGALGAGLRATGRPGEAFITIDLQGVEGHAYDPTDPACLTALEAHGRALMHALITFLQREAAGFEHATVSAIPARVGVRESRRVHGRYRVEADDLVSGAVFKDAIGLATWPQELRETARGPRWTFPASGRGGCGIPLRALRLAKYDNLWVAGRCLSCSHAAQAALRVIGTCLVTGQAAGLAAAIQARGDEPTADAVRHAIDTAIMPTAAPWHERLTQATLTNPASWERT